ncbi:hypothetical protein [Gilvibacter sp.]|uniref:hypothetical protein n=1 Tax=Gilvibacter sp. TaxID=2729997 RepID=UPI0025BFA105|nr:hypothetical protein [Gilvibacter sp.]NQX77270.1 hypothetical protein [Gilvibacter sp.]
MEDYLEHSQDHKQDVFYERSQEYFNELSQEYGYWYGCNKKGSKPTLVRESVALDLLTTGRYVKMCDVGRVRAWKLKTKEE